MIYTLTLSPSIDYNMNVSNLVVGSINRSTSEEYYPGGKGINVSMVLSKLGEKSVALGFCGGFVGKFIEAELLKNDILSDFVYIEGISRINVKLNCQDETAINGVGPYVNKSEINKLFDKINNLCSDDILVLSGAIPKNMDSNIYEEILKITSKKNILAIVDSTKDVLLNTLKYRPFLIKPNKDELEETLNIKINNMDDLECAVDKLINMGAINVIVSLGSLGAYMKGKDINGFMINAPSGNVIHTVGAGDSLIAGFLYEYVRSQDYYMALKTGVACGSATAFSFHLAGKIETCIEMAKMK